MIGIYGQRRKASPGGRNPRVMSDARSRDGATARLSGVLSQTANRLGDQKPAEILVKAQSA
jgi:hypothetical protein